MRLFKLSGLIFKRYGACLTLLLLCATAGEISAQSDSAKRYYTTFQYGGYGKNRMMNDSFDYTVRHWSLDLGMEFRRNRVLKPFVGLGFMVNNHVVQNRFDSSSFSRLPPTRVVSLAVHPMAGFEVRPGENWYFRIFFGSPIMVWYKLSHQALAEKVGIVYNNELRVQRRDFQYGVEIGRSVWKQRLDLKVDMTIGTRKIFSFPTPDGAVSMGLNLGLRYHFDG